MSRIVLTALMLSASTALAHAQSRSFDLESSAMVEAPPASAQVARYRQAQPQRAQARTDYIRHRQETYEAPPQPRLGGGFLEFLFSGAGPAQPRQYAVPAQPGPAQRATPDSIEEIYAPRTASMPVTRLTQPLPAMDPKFLPTVVEYPGREQPGTIIIDTNERFLYLVQEGGSAKRYGIGVGRPGFTWAGVHKVTTKREWPDWHPPAAMLKRQPYLPAFMPGGPDNPLGARALYLGSTLYRIHGSNEPWTIGRAVSSGCIRMRNEDVIDLYSRVGVGTKVVVI